MCALNIKIVQQKHNTSTGETVCCAHRVLETNTNSTAFAHYCMRCFLMAVYACVWEFLYTSQHTFMLWWLSKIKATLLPNGGHNTIFQQRESHWENTSKKIAQRLKLIAVSSICYHQSVFFLKIKVSYAARYRDYTMCANGHCPHKCACLLLLPQFKRRQRSIAVRR